MLYPPLVWEEQGQAPHLWGWLHDQNFHCQKIAELASWSFRPHHVLKIPIQDNKFATVLSVYAPTLQAETGVKETF